MAIHVNIGEAKTRFSELVAAAVRGEEVVVSKAGEPQVRFATMPSASAGEIKRRAAKRCRAIGMFGHLVVDHEIDVLAIKADERWNERNERRFGDLA